MSNPLNAFTVYASLALKTDEFFQQLNSAFKNITGTVAKLGTAAVSAASAGIVAFGKSAVETGQNFDKSMSQVAATMGKTTEEIADLRDFAQEMGRTTAFSATDSANALNYMALAGYDAQTAMSMLPNVLNLASAGGMDLASASDMITDSQSALGLSLEETTQLVDKMAKASSKSNTSVEQLGDAILTVGGTAKKLKGGTTELATVLGILADNGIKGSEGGTALRNIMNSLISPTDDAAAMLEQMGTSLYDSEGNMRSLNDVFIDLRNGMSGLATQAEKDKVLTTIFNARDLKSAEALISNVGDRFNELSAEIESSANAADAMAKTQLDNLAGDVTLFQSALEGAKIAVSDQLTPAIRKFVQMGSDAMSEIALAFESSDDLETAVFKMGRYLQKYIYQFVGKILEAVPQIVSVATMLVNSLGQAIVKNIPKFANSAVELLKGFAENITKNVPTAIKGFSDMLKNVSDWIKQNSKILISSGMEMIKSIANGISENLPSMINSVKEIISFIAEMISENLPLLINSALEIIKTLATYLSENLPEMIPAVIDIILKITETLTDPETLSHLVDAALAIIIGLADGIINSLPVLAEKAPEIIESLVTALGDCAEKMVSVAGTLIAKFTEALGVGDTWQDVKDSFSGAIDEIKKSFENLKSSFDTKEIEDVKKFFVDFKEDILGANGELGIFQHTIGFLIYTLSNIIMAIGKFVAAVINFSAELKKISNRFAEFKTLVASVSAIIAALILSFTTAPAAVAVAVGLAVASVVNAVKLIAENFEELKEFFPILLENIKNDLTAFGDAVGGEIYDFIQEKKAAVRQFFTDIGDNIGGWIYDRVQEVKNFSDNISDGAKMLGDDIKENLEKLKDKIHIIFGAIGRFISGLVENWESGVKDIKDRTDNLKEKIGEIPEKFSELVSDAISWGKDMIDNFIGGIKEKAQDLWDEVKELGQGIKDRIGFSEPEKGPLSNFHTFAPDMMKLFTKGIKENKSLIFNEINDVASGIKENFENPVSLNADITVNENFSSLKFPDISGENFMDNFINGVKSKEKSLSETLKNIAENIRKNFENPISLNADITANENLNSLKFPDISTVSENIYTVKSDNFQNYQNEKESPVTVENLNIYVEGMKFSSEYEIEKFIDMVANRLNARTIRKSRGTGGVTF